MQGFHPESDSVSTQGQKEVPHKSFITYQVIQRHQIEEYAKIQTILITSALAQVMVVGT